MEKGKSSDKKQCKLCELSYETDQELMNHKKMCLINQIMDIKYLEQHIMIDEPYTNTNTNTNTINLDEQKKQINKQTEAIAEQQNNILDQATQIADQRKQIMKMLAASGDDFDFY